MLKMSAWGSKLSPVTIALISIILLSVQFFGVVKGQCVSQCPPPNNIGGGGTTGFSPNQSCYDSESYVNITCSGYLYGQTEYGPCFVVDETSQYWATNTIPTCEESSCPVVTAPVDGSASPVEYNSLYDEIEYSCDEGRFLDGPSMAVCTGTGEWSPSTAPICSGNCTIPDITHGDAYSSDDILQEGSQVMIACSEGYTLTGVANVTCHDEEWNPDVGECLANCSSPDIADSDFATDQGETDHGDYIVVTCDEGFTSGTGDNVSEPLTCGNGTWDVDIYCYANCPTIPAPDDGYINSPVEPFYHGRVVQLHSTAFNCSSGFTLAGDSSSTCDNGNWTNTVPECKADCLVPYLDNSNLNDTTNSTYVPHHSNTTVICEDGYTFGYGSDFDGVLTCDDGSLDDTGFECLESCEGPIVDNSNWADRSETVPYGGSIVVDCDSGFSSGSGSEQNETLVCEGGSWNGSVFCYENCPSISAPEGGNMYPSSAPFYHNNTVYFNCSETYLFDGAPLLICDDGAWSDPVPECKEPVLCPCTGLSTGASAGIAVLATLLVASIIINIIQFIVWRRYETKPDKKGSHIDISSEGRNESFGRNDNLAYEMVQSGDRAYTALNLGSSGPSRSPIIAPENVTFLTILGSIGRGDFGGVWKGELRSNQNQASVVIRQLPDQVTKSANVLQSLKVLYDLPDQHNVVKCVGYCQQQGSLLYEFIYGGTLLTHLQTTGVQSQPAYTNLKPNKVRVDEGSLLNFAWQIAKGNQFLASKKIIHGTLCAHNVLLDKRKQCKLADYGIASSLFSNKGKPTRWISPETMQTGIQSTEGDIWSFGIVLWEIVTLGARPYPNMTFDIVRKEVANGYKMPRPRHCGQELYTVMSLCWEKEGGNRSSFDQILKSLDKILEKNHNYLSLNDLDEGLYASALDM